MHGLNLALLVFAAFWAGAFVALLVRAMIEDAAQRRLGRETLEASRDAVIDLNATKWMPGRIEWGVVGGTGQNDYRLFLESFGDPVFVCPDDPQIGPR